MITGGNINDTTMMTAVLKDIRVPRAGKGRPRTRPDRVLADKARNVVERCSNRLKQWRGIAMRSDKLLRSYRAAVSLAATLIWIKSDLINTA
jgi:transposase